MVNWQEYVAGTDPTDPASLLKMETAPGSSFFTFRWSSVQGKLYTVERTTNLSSYISVATNRAATPPTNSYTDAPGGGGAVE